MFSLPTPSFSYLRSSPLPLLSCNFLYFFSPHCQFAFLFKFLSMSIVRKDGCFQGPLCLAMGCFLVMFTPLWLRIFFGGALSGHFQSSFFFKFLNLSIIKRGRAGRLHDSNRLALHRFVVNSLPCGRIYIFFSGSY